MAAPARLSRAEQKARTREALLEAAEHVFADRGIDTPIDEVTEEAGFTKGAFYANFASKDELFLAMLDRHFEVHAERIERTITADREIEDQARDAGEGFMRAIASEPEWERLFFEFAAYAARDAGFRTELVARYRGLRDLIARLYGARAADLGVESPIPVEQIATMTFSMANGIALQRLLDPDSVPDDLYATMLVAFFSGVGVMAGANSVTFPPAGVHHAETEE